LAAHGIKRNYTQLIKLFPTQRELKGLEALIEENGCSEECAPAFSKRLHPCSVLVEINNAVFKPFKSAFWELARCPVTALNLFDLE
jgi:hypothetical protein